MKFGPQFLFLLLVTVATITLACGSSPQLKSVSVSPASANASDYPNGQVQFTAVGYYAGSSSPVSVSPEWTACPPSTPSRSVRREWRSANLGRPALTAVPIMWRPLCQ
jgi:hypothetical protein